ncbi:hypothetical protein PBI_244_90 [Mycobacterium phage 244]|uniref:Transmembrane protein n=1 Tax=Mycobacterium phage 244 TaxID=2902792 RepID=Q1A0Y1_9CAUD|nr:gp90 [Mycobacterium phage 244]ABD58065.1 hypothetical protein PBI_244_90 [Mycobacterium phage 244]QXN74650.1 membrane protein [Mycobacterium phage JeTaime]
MVPLLIAPAVFGAVALAIFTGSDWEYGDYGYVKRQRILIFLSLLAASACFAGFLLTAPA